MGFRSGCGACNARDERSDATGVCPFRDEAGARFFFTPADAPGEGEGLTAGVSPVAFFALVFAEAGTALLGVLADARARAVLAPAARRAFSVAALAPRALLAGAGATVRLVALASGGVGVFVRVALFVAGLVPTSAAGGIGVTVRTETFVTGGMGVTVRVETFVGGGMGVTVRGETVAEGIGVVTRALGFFAGVALDAGGAGVATRPAVLPGIGVVDRAEALAGTGVSALIARFVVGKGVAVRARGVSSSSPGSLGGLLVFLVTSPLLPPFSFTTVRLDHRHRAAVARAPDKEPHARIA